MVKTSRSAPPATLDQRQGVLEVILEISTGRKDCEPCKVLPDGKRPVEMLKEREPKTYIFCSRFSPRPLHPLRQFFYILQQTGSSLDLFRSSFLS